MERKVGQEAASEGSNGPTRGGKAPEVSAYERLSTTRGDRPDLPPGGTFYFASAYHLPGAKNGGADLAGRAIRRIELLTEWKCTSRWPFDFRHGETWYADQAAAADLADIRRADLLIFAPTTPTSRGTHVELGYALALGKAVIGWRPAGIEGTAFDSQVEAAPPQIASILEEELARAVELGDRE